MLYSTEQSSSKTQRAFQIFEAIKVPVTFDFSLLQILVTLLFYIGIPVVWVIVRACVWVDYSDIYNQLIFLPPDSPEAQALLTTIMIPYTWSFVFEIFSPMIAMLFLIFTTKQKFYKSGIFFLFIWAPGTQIVALMCSTFAGSVVGLSSLLIDFIFKGIIVVWMILFFKSLRRMFKLAIEHWVTSLIIVILVIGLAYLLSWSVGLISSESLKVENSANQEYLENLFSDKGLGMVSVILTTLLVAPLIEEFIFRGLLGDFTKNSWYSAILTTFYFAFVHISAAGDWAAIFLYLGSAFIFGLTYKFTKNIYYASAGHFALNLISLIVLLVATL